jgi:hypothetical protein
MQTLNEKNYQPPIIMRRIRDGLLKRYYEKDNEEYAVSP